MSLRPVAADMSPIDSRGLDHLETSRSRYRAIEIDISAAVLPEHANTRQLTTEGLRVVCGLFVTW